MTGREYHTCPFFDLFTAFLVLFLPFFVVSSSLTLVFFFLACIASALADDVARFHAFCVVDAADAGGDPFLRRPLRVLEAVETGGGHGKWMVDRCGAMAVLMCLVCRRQVGTCGNAGNAGERWERWQPKRHRWWYVSSD